MMNHYEKFILALGFVTIEEAQSALDAKIQAESGQEDAIVESLVSSGWIEVDAQHGQMTADGRPVVSMLGRSWVLPPEEFARRRDVMLAAAAQRASESAPNMMETVCRSLIADQLCGGTLVRASVCLKSALGRSGVVATLTCDVCGHVTAIMRGDA
jgi:hypothetical protein